MLSLNGEAADVDKFAVPGVVLAMAVSLVGVAVVGGRKVVLGDVLSDTLLTVSIFGGATTEEVTVVYPVAVPVPLASFS